MANYQGYETTDKLFEAGRTWLNQSLAEGRSVFSDQIIWTTENIHALESWFSPSPGRSASPS